MFTSPREAFCSKDYLRCRWLSFETTGCLIDPAENVFNDQSYIDYAWSDSPTFKFTVTKAKAKPVPEKKIVVLDPDSDDSYGCDSGEEDASSSSSSSSD